MTLNDAIDHLTAVYRDTSNIDMVRALSIALPILQAHASKPPNRNKPWTIPDEATLAAGFAAGADTKTLAKQLGRSHTSIIARLRRLGLTE